MKSDSHSWPIVGVLPDIMKRGFSAAAADFLARNGSPARMTILGRDFYAIGHPDHIRHALIDNADNYRRTRYYKIMRSAFGRSLLTTDGEEWYWRRVIAQPSFCRKNAGSFVDLMTDRVQQMLDRWSNLPDEEVVDVVPELLNLTMGIAAKCMFGVDFRPDCRRLTQHFETFKRFFRKSFSIPIPLFWKLPTPLNVEFRKAVAELDEIVYRLIDERRDQPLVDLLSTLRLSQDEETGRRLTPREIRNEVVTLFFAGHETTTAAIQWALYLIGRSPDVRERLEAEVDGVLGNRLPVLGDLPQLRYAEMVFKETLRLYPPIPSFSRTNLEADKIGGMSLPAGSYLNVIIWAAHLHPEFWHHPSEFDPERFAPENLKGRHKCAYLPFGAGPHQCIGYHFATIEAVIAIAMIIQRFRLEPAGALSVVPLARLTLRPKGGMPMVLKRRDRPHCPISSGSVETSSMSTC